MEAELGEEHRTFSKNVVWIFSIIAALYSIFHIYTAGFGAFPNIIQRSMHLGFSLTIGFALYPIIKNKVSTKIPIYDWIFIMLSVFVTLYTFVSYDRIVMSTTKSTNLDIIVAVLFLLMVMEMSRRTLGWIFPILVGISLVYAFFGNLIPGRWGHPGFSVTYVLQNIYMSTNGLWGQVTGISATVVAIFIIFGSFLLHTGGGKTFIDLSIKLAGRLVGGPAKVAIVGSSLFGTISGNGAANVATTGTLTIPMMKRLNYKPSFAGAVEASSSSGGQFLPPIMGAGAFVMAEILGIQYASIAFAAIIPALLFYLGLWFTTHFLSLRFGYKPLTKSDIPEHVSSKIGFISLLMFIVPIGILIFFFALGYTPMFAAFSSIVSLLCLFLLFSKGKDDFIHRCKSIGKALTEGGRGIVTIAALVASAQILVMNINLTGIGVKFSQLVVTASGSSLIFALLISTAVCLVLGMGMPTVAAYILAATIVAPSLMKLGVEALTAHLFVFYFAALSAITPPVCSAVYVAATIAKTNWFTTSLRACQLALSGFLVPYFFVYNNALLMHGSVWEIGISAVLAVIGIWALSAAVGGFLYRKHYVWERILLGIGAMFLLFPTFWTVIIGLIIIAVIIVYTRRTKTPPTFMSPDTSVSS